MNQRRGLQSLPRLFVGHFLGGQPPEFVVDHGEQLGGIGLCLRVRQPLRIGGRVRSNIARRLARDRIDDWRALFHWVTGVLRIRAEPSTKPA